MGSLVSVVKVLPAPQCSVRRSVVHVFSQLLVLTFSCTHHGCFSVKSPDLFIFFDKFAFIDTLSLVWFIC